MNFDTPKLKSEKPEDSSERISEEVLSMYRVPGCEEEYTKHSIGRYFRNSRDFEKFSGTLEAALKFGNFDEVAEELIPFLISRVEDEEKSLQLMRRGITANSSAVRHEAADHFMRWYKGRASHNELLLLCFESDDPVVRQTVAGLVQFSYGNEKIDIIQAGFDTNDPIVIWRLASEIWYLSGEDKKLLREKLLEIIESSMESYESFLSFAPLILEVGSSSQESLQKKLAECIRHIFETGNSRLFFDAARNIEYTGYSEWIELIRLVIGSGDVKAIKTLFSLDKYLSTEDRLKMRREIAAGVRDDFEIEDVIDIRRKTESIDEIEKPMRAEHIRAGLESGDLATMCAVAESIPTAEEFEQSGLIRLALESGQPLVTRLVMGFVGHAKESLRGDLIDLGLRSGDSLTMVVAAKAIRNARENGERVSFIRTGISSGITSVMLASLDAIESVELGDQEKLRTFARDRMGPTYVEGPLYREMEEGFSRADFRKNRGAATTLLGNFSGTSLKGKAIVRHFEMEHFEEWKRLYDDHALWKNEGFDYVPIEPIVSFAPRKNGLIDVFSGVLDLSLQQWKIRDGEWSEELDADAERLMDTLSKTGYHHGHIPPGRSYTHDGNFCLRFFRNEDGSIDYSRKPRLYLIDFDQGTSS